MELLEDRVTPAAYLFIDYGVNFPGGTLSTTQGAFRDVADDGTPGLGGSDEILGTTLDDADGNFNAGTQLDIVAETFTAADRAAMLAIIQRAYLPLDVTVVELTATAQMTADGRSVAGATSMADVVNTLRGGNAASRDAYVFVGTFIVDPGGADQRTYTGGGGNSPGANGFGETSDLGAASNAHDDVAAVFSAGGFRQNTVNNIAHEAGHLFGLRHSITNDPIDTNVTLFHNAEIMSYQNTSVITSSLFTRYPMVHGDDNSPGFTVTVDIDATARTITRASGTLNFTTQGLAVGQQIRLSGAGANDGVFTIQSITASVITLTAAGTLTNDTGESIAISWGPLNYNDIASRNGHVTIYDQLANDANVLANPNYSFVSGTGAHDIITITRTGANATVTVQAFTDSGYMNPITVPGEMDGTYTFTIPLDRSILVYAGGSNDRIVVDGDLGVDIEIDGMLGDDTLIVNGKAAASANFTPNATSPDGVDLDGIDGAATPVTSFGGTITIGARSIVFREFETNSTVTIQDVTTLTLSSPGGVDSFTVTAPASQARVEGTVDGGTDIVPLLLSNVTTFVIDTGNGDGGGDGDLVTVSAPFSATGLTNVSVTTGAGADALWMQTANLTLPGGGTFTFNGGADHDTIAIDGDSDFILSDVSVQSSGGGSVALANVEEASLTGGGGVNTFTVTGWSGTATLRGAANDDVYNITLNGSGSQSVTIEENAGEGNDSATVHGTGVVDAFVVRPTTLTLGGEVVNYDGDLDGLVVNGLNGADTFDVSGAAGTAITINGGNPLVSPGDALTYTGTGTATLTFNGPGNGTISQTGLQPVVYTSIEECLDFVGVTVNVVVDAGPDADDGTRDTFTVRRHNGDLQIFVNSEDTEAGCLEFADVSAVTLNGSSDDDIFNLDNSGGLLDIEIYTNGAGGVNTLNIVGDAGVPIQRETLAVLTPGDGALIFDPDDSGGIGAVAATLGDDAEEIYFTGITIINDVKPLDTGATPGQFDVFLPGYSNAIGLGDGPVFAGFATSEIDGAAPAIRFANKPAVTVNGLSGADTFTIDMHNAADGLLNLRVYGNDLTGGALSVHEPTWADDDAADTFHLKSLAVPTAVFGQGGDDLFNVFLTTAAAISIDGGAGSGDRLDDESLTANTFFLTGADQGSTDAVASFVAVEHLVGDSLTDVFRFSPGASLGGTIDGELGHDVLDYSLFGAAVTTRLQGRTSTGLGTGGLVADHFANLEELVGSVLVDTLVGADAASTWTLTGPNAGHVNGTFHFSAVENLTGGSNDDTFVVNPGGSLSGVLNGGAFAESNTLVDNTGTTNLFTINGPDAGLHDNIHAFTGIQTLIGSTETDTFRFVTGGSLGGDVDGGEGIDALDYSRFGAAVTTNLETDTTTAVAGFFFNLEGLVGSPRLDTLIGENDENAWAIDGPNAGAVDDFFSFSAVENLRGGTARDVFHFLDDGALTGRIDGQAGLDWLDYSEIAAAIRVNLTARTASRTRGVVGVEHVLGSAGGYDVLVGNALNNIFVTHGTNNALYGMAGRDFLVGGQGRSLLNGGLGDDLIVSGNTAFDADLDALQDLHAAWSAPGTLASRLTSVLTGGGLANGNALQLNTTVFLSPVPPGPRGARGGAFRGNTAVGSAGSDLFFARWASIIVDFNRLLDRVVKPV